MVVIGGLGSIPGAVLGALYLEGLPALFGANATIQFLTSGLGLIAFILYLPGGLGELLNRFGDVVTIGAAHGAGPPVDPATPARRWPGHRIRRRRGPAPAGRATRARSGRLVRRPETTARPGSLVENLGVTFGGVRAVDDVSFTAEPGAIVGLIGANGSGKTTTLDMVSGLVAPQRGTVRLDGTDLAEYLPEERQRVGMVRSFQDCRLFPELSVLDVLLLCEDVKQEVAVLSTTLQLPWARRAEKRKRAAVDQVIGAFGLERFRHHRTAELSTGTRRVVDLASIILAEPRLLLLDEPTAGIAQREAEAFIPLLRRLHQIADTTIVLVEHDVPLVFELCTQCGGHGAGAGGGRRPTRRGARRSPGPGRLPRRQRRGTLRVRADGTRETNGTPDRRRSRRAAAQ